MTASRMLRGMVGMNPMTWKSHAHLEFYCFLYACLLIVWIFPNSQEITRYTKYGQQDSEWGNQSLVKTQWNPDSWTGWVMPGLLLGISLLVMTNGKPSEFLYFQF
jgi:hypothetical protein